MIMKKLVGKLTGSGKEKYPQSNLIRHFDFSIEVPESDKKDKKYDAYYSISRIKYKNEKQEKRRTFQIDPIGAFSLGIWSIDYMGMFLQPSDDNKGADIIGQKKWRGYLSGNGYMRNLKDVSDTEVEFSIELSTKQLESGKATLKFYTIFKLKSLDGTVDDNFPIFASCPLKSFLLAVSLLDARVSYFDRDFEY